MHKKNKLVPIIVIIIGMSAIGGFALLILSSKEFTDVAFDLIILLTAVISIGIALYSQVSADKEARRVEKIARDVSSVDRNLSDDMTVDKSVRYKLDRITALEEEIYKKVGGRKDPKDLTKEYREKHPESKKESTKKS